MHPTLTITSTLAPTRLNAVIVIRRVTSHLNRNCPLPRKKHCYRCGTPDVTVSTKCRSEKQRTKRTKKDKEHPELKVLKADKTNETVIMDSAYYDKKIMDILRDKKTYKQVKLNPINTYQKRNNDLIKSGQEKDYISPSIAKTLPSKIYGLPKLHKESFSLRPIVSCIQSLFNALALFQSTILNHTAYQNKYYIKNSFDFNDKIKNVKVPDNYILISLDVISLYTSIPNLLAIKSVEKRWGKISTLTEIPKDESIFAIDTTLYLHCLRMETLSTNKFMGAPWELLFPALSR